ncbi:MAG: GNAT family N-acetyltransferase [Actinomycetota bacterium]|nr:GNAT family N-acetyltransferase [Actinomycetota bacterium]
MQWPPPRELTLIGEAVTLRPAVADRDGTQLFAALDDERVWRHLNGRPGGGDGWADTLREREARGWLSWIVRLRVATFGLAAGTVIGTSSYLEVEPGDARLEIGATAYTPDAWGSIVNPETKLLLLQYAFEVLGAGRVQLKTDIRNKRSAQAIARLGATFEGTLRRYQRRSDGSVRDTLVFSIIAEQWPQVRAGLHARLAENGSS